MYLVSDLMITDYSSTMFDYANLMRPMVFHMYDADSYKQDVRGLYLSPEELPGPITKRNRNWLMPSTVRNANFLIETSNWNLTKNSIHMKMGIPANE